MTAPAIPDAQPLINAVEAAVTSHGFLIGDGEKPEDVTDRPYIVAWWDAGRITDRTLRSRDGFRVSAIFHSVGQSPEAVRIAVKALRTAILGLNGAQVGGWKVQTPSHHPAIPLARDDDKNPPIWTQADEWHFRLSPA
ncbi:hypothetical protein [Geodermatophilus sp. DSM 45219]|uniref:hypothetical protein n=1 Tax=Geodermatophilus sp. DSM 45219 TaxID=1881103 RepID=UPI00115FEA6C|nr:hypothetical protein [Geodermatophilus sp. DSM 45219]